MMATSMVFIAILNVSLLRILPSSDATGDTLDLGLAYRMMSAILVLFSLLGLCFRTWLEGLGC
jgi:hypothetical protein